ncbi:uncharacterized protein BX664DRAFT_341584 [Halteromyces radiatus]|uniref:uncharacterized protein n=1 Tax=Halteromyces radiatus TaxID=101107 RepID=UPI00221F7FBE|nr:uncharacterized protein BX664DRAFT_341584 [Halteromyces radiatus]KAI8079840.1 hypothetical protein BX664DRAFT_341584 [Halteromyces radiatus]
MGCCHSSEKPTVYEVTLDHDGIARHVSEGQGTHYIHVSESNETILEEKPNLTPEEKITSPNPTFQKPLVPYLSKQRIYPSSNNNISKEEKTRPPSFSIGNTINKV